MKKINLLFILSLFALITFNSCQDEVIEVTEPSSEETIVAGSSLAVSMMRTATNDGSGDNIIDNANCLSVELPVTVVVNGVEIIIDSEEDYDLIEAVFDEFDDDNDVLEIQFPIVIILSDYSEITIESYEELEVFIQECSGENEVDDDIECIDFVYPISISIYNANFQVIDTVVIQSDEQLYFFIEELEGGVLASINFPITMILSNGNEVVINNNAELEAAIENADGTCDEDDDNDYNDDDIEDCDFNLNGLGSYLMECPMEAYFFTSSGDLIDTLDLVFGDTVSVNGDPAITENTGWILNESAAGYVMTIDGLVTFDILNGTWLLEGCDDEYVYFTYDGITMKLEQDCNVSNDPLGCLEVNDIVMCDENNDGVEVFNLYEGLSDIDGCTVDSTVSVSYHTSFEDAENNTNPLSNATSFTNFMNPQTIYVRIEVLNNPSQFEVLEMNLILENCSTSCTELDVDGYLQECVWNIVSLNGDDNLIEFDLDFMANQGLVVTGAGLNLQGTWSTSQSANGGVEVVIDGIAGPNIQAINGSWVIVDCDPDRLEMVMGDYTMVIEQANCYTEEELLNTMSTCSWEVYSLTVNNEDLTADYNDVVFTFFENDFAIAEVLGTTTVNYGNMEAEGTGSDELVVLFFMYGFTSELNDYYTVSSISENQVTLTSLGDKVLVLSRNCDYSNQDADTEQIKNWLDEGTWEITYATMESVDESTDYDNVTFDFQQNATIIGINYNNNVTSELQYEVLRDQGGNLRLVINYLGIFPYWQMDDDWYITEVQDSSIELHHVSEDSNNEFVLIFEKM